MKIEFFINSQRLDTFEDENISIVDSIQNAKDPAKIFTSFSREVTLPASNRNNDIFNHYYNFNIIGGFDARKREPAIIKINGFDFRTGFIQLNSVKLKNNKASSYNIVFTGQLAELSDVIRDDKLSDLTGLSKFNHIYNESNVIQAFQNYVSVSNNDLISDVEGDLCYPFISTTKRYAFTSTLFEVDEDGNVTTNPLTFRELKPALRLRAIIEEIGLKYGFTFISDFFKLEEFSKLVLFLHRDQGRINQIRPFNKNIPVIRNNFTFDSGDDNLIPIDDIFSTFDNNLGFQDYQLRFTFNVVGKGFFRIKLLDSLTNETINSFDQEIEDDSPQFTFNLESDFNKNRFFEPVLIFKIEGDSTVDSINIDARVVEFTNNATSNAFYSFNENPIIPLDEVNVPEQMPDMTVIDFLTSIFKMFNLTAEVNENKEITIKPLDVFYSEGRDIEISKYIDVSNTEVQRFQPFTRIKFKNQEPNTFLINQRDRLVGGIPFGGLEVDLSQQVEDGRSFTGGDYDVSTGFEKMLFERLRDTNNDLTGISFGMSLDDKLEPTVGKPIIAYADREFLTGFPNFTIDTTSVSKYMRPSNVFRLGTQTINFGSEIDEFTGITNNNSLFENFHKKYIQRVFNRMSRIFVAKAILPLDIILDYKLNDKFIVNGQRFLINRIDLNINKREAKLELINDI